MKIDLPTEHKALAGIVKPQGFTTETWGAAGDRVIAAYLAVKMEKENPGALAQMKAMDKSMLDMMPPATREQFNGILAMMEAIENVDPADKQAIASSLPALDAFMENRAGAEIPR